MGTTSIGYGQFRRVCLGILFCALGPVLTHAGEDERTGEGTKATEQTSANWTQWRGPQRDSRIDAAPWPAQLDEAHLSQAWRVELSPSYSGPLVVNDRVYVTSTDDQKFETVRALERSTGKVIWESRWEGAMRVPFFARSNGDWIRSTPALDGQRLFVAGMRDVLVCLDAESGQEQWRVDFMEKLGTPLPAFGFVCSPLVMGGHVYVQAGGSFVKLDKQTGEIVWQVLQDGGGMFGSAFSSPFPTTLQGVSQILVQTRTKLTGVEPESGEVLWSHEIPAFRGMNILTPTVYRDSVFTSSYGGRSLLLTTDKQGDQWTVSEKWNSKTQGYMSSPVVIDKYAYVHLKNQRFTCLDLETGQEQWTTKPFGKYWSMIANGKQILALDERGELLLIAANPQEFQLIDRCQISQDPTWAHLAVSGDEIFIRELKAIAAYRWKKP